MLRVFENTISTKHLWTTSSESTQIRVARLIKGEFIVSLRDIRAIKWTEVCNFLTWLDLPDIKNCYIFKLATPGLRILHEYPVDTGRKLNVHKTFKRGPGRLLNGLCTFNLHPVSTVNTYNGFSCDIIKENILEIVISYEKQIRSISSFISPYDISLLRIALL